MNLVCDLTKNLQHLSTKPDYVVNGRSLNWETREARIAKQVVDIKHALADGLYGR